MEAKNLIIRGIDMIDKFYNEIGEFDMMCITQSCQKDEDNNWERVEEFGYKSIVVYSCYETYCTEYESVRAVRITKWDEKGKEVHTIYRI